MTDVAVKKRLARAKAQAIDHFLRTGYSIIRSDNGIFCFIASRRRELRCIRVVVDRITDQDMRLAKEFPAPASCSREIFCQKPDGFEIQEIEE